MKFAPANVPVDVIDEAYLLRTEGASWKQVAAFFASKGIVSRKGTPYTMGTVFNLVFSKYPDIRIRRLNKRTKAQRRADARAAALAFKQTKAPYQKETMVDNKPARHDNIIDVILYSNLPNPEKPKYLKALAK